MSIHTGQVNSGFDIEAIINRNTLRYIFQLLMDCGVFPTEIQLGNDDFTFSAMREDDVPRLYEPHPDGEYDITEDDAFDIHFHEFDEDAAHVYLRYNMLNNDLFFRLKNTIDVQDFCRKLKSYLEKVGNNNNDDDEEEFDIHEYFTMVTVILDSEDFDFEDPQSNINPNLAPLMTAINDALTTAIEDLKENKQSAFRIFIEEQLELLTMVRISDIGFRAFTRIYNGGIGVNNSLGIYANFILLDYDRGFVSPRGALMNTQDFTDIEDEKDVSIGTSEGFITQLAYDLIIKNLIQFQLDNKVIKKKDIEDKLLSDHFPLEIPGGLFDYEGDVASFFIKKVTVKTKQHTFKEKHNKKTKLESLKITIKTDEYLANIFEVGSENLVVFATPTSSTDDENGFTILDALYEVNLRIDLLRSFGSLSPLILPAIPILGVINAIAKKDMPSGRVSQLDPPIPLSQITLHEHRWDPFYSTLHQLFLEQDELILQDERLFVSANVHLAKDFIPFPRAYVRDTTGHIDRLLYKVEALSETDQETNLYATDREEYTLETDDTEQDIVSIPYSGRTGNVRSRIEQKKLITNLAYNPYCIVEGEQRIESIRMLSAREVALVENRIRNEFINPIVDEIIAELSDAGFVVEDEQMQAMRAALTEYVRDMPEYSAYIDTQFETDVKTRIYLPETLRLKLSPEDLAALVASKALVLTGYTPVNRKSGIYFRDIYEKSELSGVSTHTDNLLSLPRCG